MSLLPLAEKQMGKIAETARACDENAFESPQKGSYARKDQLAESEAQQLWGIDRDLHRIMLCNPVDLWKGAKQRHDLGIRKR